MKKIYIIGFCLISFGLSTKADALTCKEAQNALITCNFTNGAGKCGAEANAKEAACVATPSTTSHPYTTPPATPAPGVGSPVPAVPSTGSTTTGAVDPAAPDSPASKTNATDNSKLCQVSAPGQGLSLVDAFKCVNPTGVIEDGKIKALDANIQNNYIENKDAATTVTGFLQKIANTIMYFLSSILILFIVINAAKMLLATGDPEAIGQARKGLLMAIGGFFVVIFSFYIVKTLIAIMYIVG